MTYFLFHLKKECVILQPQYKPQSAAAVVVVILFVYLSFLQEEVPLYVTSIRGMQWPARNYGRKGYVYIICFFFYLTHAREMV